MPRSVNAVASRARRKRILKEAKGLYGKRKNVYTVAKNVLEKGLQYRYVGRKLKKREYRGLWIARVHHDRDQLEPGGVLSDHLHHRIADGEQLHVQLHRRHADNQPGGVDGQGERQIEDVRRQSVLGIRRVLQRVRQR